VYAYAALLAPLAPGNHTLTATTKYLGDPAASVTYKLTVR
jgi:hypothetical protein